MLRGGIVVTGTINAGKTTLAKKLAASLGAQWISSDAIRDELPGRRAPRGARVFNEVRTRLERALEEGRLVVLDSTGMSHRFRALLRGYRDDLVHVHVTLDDEMQFEERERGRLDRRDGRVSSSAFRRSQAVEFHEAPDLTLTTDRTRPEELYAAVCAFLASDYGVARTKF